MWSNVHTHRDFCDGKETMAAYASKANEQEMLSLGFSSHAPLPFECKWCMQEDKLDAYLRDIDELKKAFPQVAFFKGLEVDYVPNLISPRQFEGQLDYTIGSIHFVDCLSDGRHWEIDGLHAVFLEGLAQLFDGNIRTAVSRYYQLTRDMISDSCPTIVGHLDKIKIQNIEEKFFSEDDPWYQYEVRETLATIASHGLIVEVNTRGIYQKKSPTTYPSPWILSLICEMDIPITLSSDAHHPDDLTNRFGETARLLQAIGFKTISVLHESKWLPFLFNEHGIIR
jgi:histidinol-phosphatase (PHP family)